MRSSSYKVVRSQQAYLFLFDFILLRADDALHTNQIVVVLVGFVLLKLFVAITLLLLVLLGVWFVLGACLRLSLFFLFTHFY